MKWPALHRARPVLRDFAAQDGVGIHDEAAVFPVHTVQPLFSRLHIDPESLCDRMCPVELASRRCQVLVLEGYARDDHTRALLLTIRQAGLELADPPLLVVPACVLSEINRRWRVVDLPEYNGAQRVLTPRHVLFAVLDDLVAWALKADASDIHLTLLKSNACADIAFSVNGACVRPSEFQSITIQTAAELLSVAWMGVRGGNGAVFDPTREQQGRLDRHVLDIDVGLRWASLVTHLGPTVCLRLLNRLGHGQAPGLHTLGYTSIQLDTLYRARLLTGGAVVLAGMVGSGKSTTLAALVSSISPERKIITLEDPVEYPIKNALQCLVSGLDAATGAEDLSIKLKTIKRSAAHDVLIGEIRDVEGGRALTDLVLSGTNVYTTLHASSALQILLRLGSSLIGVPESLLAMPGVLKLLVYQALVRRLCLQCAMSASQWQSRQAVQCALGQTRSLSWACDWLEQLCTRFKFDPAKIRFHNPEGCCACRGKISAQQHGYDGRLLLAEMIEPSMSSIFHEALVRRSLHEQVIEWQAQCSRQGRCDLVGYVPVSQQAAQQVREGLLDPREFEYRFSGVA